MGVDKGPPPPKNVNEWYERFHVNEREWPFYDDRFLDENLREVDLKKELNIPISKEEINEFIQSEAPFDVSLIDGISKEVDLLHRHLDELFSKVFLKQETLSDSNDDTKEHRRHSVQFENDDEKVSTDYSMRRKTCNTVQSLKVEYPGFKTNIITPLPSSIEALQLLNKVTERQGFKPRFMKRWQQYFLSESSAKILQDAFWWFFLEYSKNNSHQQMLLFNRISSSYTSLFVSLPSSFKDVFLLHYPRCLTECIYSAFCNAIPDTVPYVEGYRSHIFCVLYEWICGTCPQESQNSDDDSDNKNLYIGEFQTARNQNKPIMRNLAFDIDNILAIDGGNAKCGTTEQAKDIEPSPLDAKSSSKENNSYAVEAVSFDLDGHSPLISHYLSSIGLYDSESRLKGKRKVQRTQHQPIESDVNSDEQPRGIELINQSKVDLKERKEALNKSLEITHEEIRKSKRSKKRELKTLKKLQQQLLSRQFDIKILSDQILEILASDY